MFHCSYNLMNSLLYSMSCVVLHQALGLSIAYTNEPAIPDCVPSGCNLAFICGEFDGPLFDKLWARVRALKSSRVR